jgi:hypothetical protein
MHSYEKALRIGLKLVIQGVTRLPNKLSTPILSALATVPHWIGLKRNLIGATTFWASPMNGVQERFEPQPSIGILIQGPLTDNESVRQVEKSIRIYKEIFPRSPIVVSTWDGSRSLVEQLVLDTDIHVVFSLDPGPSFPSNIDRQSVSTSAGLKELDKLGVEFALKTRADHRVSSPSALVYLKSVWSLFPNPNRIIASSYGSGRFRLYGWTEQLQFGKTAALLHYWDGLPTESPHEIAGATAESKALARLGLAVHESRLNVRYLARKGVIVKWNWEDHLSAFTGHFGIADSYELRHIQLGREKTVIDHVYPWNDDFTNLYERHATFGEWLIYCQGSVEVSTPMNALLVAAMKVPHSDLALLDASLVKTRGNQPS